MTTSSGTQVERARAEAERLLADLPSRLAHSRAVAARAASFSLSQVEAEALVAAAWLHDVGYAAAIADTGFHPLDGARWLARLGWDDRVVALVAHHSAAVQEAAVRGLTQELEALPEPTLKLLDLLTWADMTTSPTGEMVSVHERLREILERYDEDGPVGLAVRRSAPLLIRTVERVASQI